MNKTLDTKYNVPELVFTSLMRNVFNDKVVSDFTSLHLHGLFSGR